MIKTSEIIIRDPYIFADFQKQTYYMYGTTYPEMGYSCIGFHYWKSNDLNIWDGPFTAFIPDENFWGTKDFWAPEVHFYNGKYFMFASCKAENRCRATHIFCADTPEGPFAPVSSEPATPHDWECLDGTLYVEDNIPYIVFCHEWKQVEDGEIAYSRLDSNLEKVISAPQILFKASDAKWTRTFERDGKKYNRITDGPFVFKYNNRLLMLWSSKGPEGCGGYAMGYAESASGKIAGPWIHHEKIVFFENGGHGMVFQDFRKKLRCIVHQPNQSPSHPVIFELPQL